MIHRSVRIPVLVVLAALATPAHAQTYPTRPVTIITPFAAGSVTDATARAIAAHLQETLGQTVHRGEPRRCRRHAGGERGGEGGARWPHAADHHQFDSLGSARSVQERALRPDQGFHAGGADRQLSVADRGQSEPADQVDAGAGRLRQGQSRQALLCARQQHRPHHRRGAQATHQHRYCPRALSQQSGGHDRSDRGPHSADDTGLRHRAAAAQGAEDPPACGAHEGAQHHAAGRSVAA